jgi:ergothioneine biosynthesis protein EgtB
MSTASETAAAPAFRDLTRRYAAVRGMTETLTAPLSPEDCCIQSMISCSPTRWHLAHTSWFFETFLLKRDPAYRPCDEHYEVLFNSYYNSVGEQFPRDRRGLLSRPSRDEVLAYRRHIDDAVGIWLASGRVESDAELATIVEWGLQHEQQHQELILTDVKHLLSLNPLWPAYRQPSIDAHAPSQTPLPFRWLDFDEGLYEIGHAGDGFAYDNESPRHRLFLERFQLASRAVTSGEYVEFLEDGGYQRPEFWLSEGWHGVEQLSLKHPLYWRHHDGAWLEFTLAGLGPLDLAAPTCHLSFFEADAYARWAGARLPTEAEWEIAARDVAPTGNFVDTLLAAGRPIHPSAVGPQADHAGAKNGAKSNYESPAQLFGDVWEWTASPYVAYPGYAPPAGALGEYNGKFMCNQYVLRGGSVATDSSHIRATYRNFFPPDARWQFTGLRLAK